MIISSYFMHRFSFSIPFHNGTLDSFQLTEFACRIAALSNNIIKFNGNEFQSVNEFVENGSPQNISVAMFGYYGQTSICMPRFYVAYGASSWEFTIIIITVNLLSFVFIAVGYIWIVKHSSKSSANVGRAQNKRANDKRQNAATHCSDHRNRLLLWIPICIMAYLRLGVKFSDITYQISAVLLLPINSALNPFLFTSFLDQLIAGVVELMSWFERIIDFIDIKACVDHNDCVTIVCAICCLDC